MEPVLLERCGALAVVSINRPESRNSLDLAVKTALRDTLQALAADDAVRAVVLTGTGGHFCAGQDLKEHAEILAGNVENVFNTVEEHYSPIVRAIATMPKPVVAAVEGACVGAGLGFALACDLRVFGSAAKLGTAFSAIGLTCDSGLALTLPQAIGASRARELVLTADPFSVEQAIQWGIGGRVVEPGQALETAIALAERFAAGPTLAYAESKRLLALAGTATLDEVLAAEGAGQQRLGATADHAGAVRSFLAKQQPTFDGR